MLQKEIGILDILGNMHLSSSRRFLFFTENVRKIVSEAYMMLKSKLPGIMESMSLYLASKETEYILFKPIKVSVIYTQVFFLLNTVTRFQTNVERSYSGMVQFSN